jgi:hypothetical protein
MASGCMQRFKRSGLLEAFAWRTPSCKPCVRTVVHSSSSCRLRRLHSSRPAMRSGSSFVIESEFTLQEQEQLALIRTASAPAETAYGLVQDFLTMVHKREGERLDAWIEAAQASQVPELHHFVNGILKDKDAVMAGLTLAYSNGSVEAQVQKRETWSSARCLAARSCHCCGNACSTPSDGERYLLTGIEDT